MNCIDLRSDTVTLPTPEMRTAMATAEVGDDIYQDDPTVNRLQLLAAQRLGKEAALFVPSGTMGNQVAIMSHTQYGDEIICGKNSHIVHYEAGAAARLSGVSYAIIDNPNLQITAADVLANIRPDDAHFPRTGLVCLENALTNGDVVPLEVMRATYQAAHQHKIPVHMDGARVFNAALALKVDVKELASCADSVMFCVSKGLCSPVGSLLCGTTKFIDQARRNRKVVGGGLRQSGVLAACGIISLEKMTGRLHEDHENAQYLAAQFNNIPGLSADTSRVKINMVFWKASIPGFKPETFVPFMLEKGIKVSGLATPTDYRWVTHNDVNREKLDFALEAVKDYIKTLK